MSNTEPPQIELLAPGQNPRVPRVLLGPVDQDPPKIQAPNAWRDAFRDIEGQQREQRQRDLLRVFKAATEVHPDLAARAQELGGDLGLDSRLAEDNIEKVEKAWEEWQYRAYLQSGGDPVVLRRMLDPEFARIGRDDLENLGALSELSRQWTAGDLGREASRIRYKQSQTGGILTKAEQRRLDEIDEQLMRLPRDSAGHGLMSLVYGGTRMLGGMWDTALYSGGAAVAGFAVAGPPGAAMAGLSTLGISSGRQIGGEAYGRMREIGIAHEIAKGKAEWAAFWGGLLEAGALRFAGGKIAGDALKNYLAMRAGRQAVTAKTRGQAVQKFLGAYGATAGAETFVELAQETISWGLTGQAIEETEDKTKLRLEQRGDFWENMEETLFETLRGVAILSSFGPAVQFRVNLQRAQVGEHTEQVMQRFHKGVSESKLPSRSRTMFQDFLEQAGQEHGEVQRLYFDLDAFTEAMQETGTTMRELEELAPDVAKAFRQAEAQDLGVLEIPTSTWGANFVGRTDLGTAMQLHARVEPGGMTALEAQQFRQNQEAIVEEGKKLLESVGRTTEEFKAQFDQVKKQRYAQLVAAGQQPKHATVAANLHAHKVAVLADRMDMAPQEVAKRYFAEVRSERQVAIIDTADEELPRAGETVDGRKVLTEVPNRSSIDASIANPTVLEGVREIPMAAFTLDEAPLATDERTVALAEEIKQSGEIAPLIVGLDDQGPYIIEGAHRYDALKILGAKSFPAVVAMEPREVLEQNILSIEQASRAPWGQQATEDPMVEVLVPDMATALRDLGKVAANAATIRDLPFLRIKEGATDAEVIEAYVAHVAENLDWLFQQMDPAERARARQWYDGGRKFVERWANRYGISRSQAAAVIAVLSPQREWFVNMTMAERMLDMAKALGGYAWDDAMGKKSRQKKKATKKDPKPGLLIPRPDAYKGKGGPTRLKEIVVGKTLDEVIATGDWQVVAYWMRVYDRAHNERTLRKVTPEGGVLGTAKDRIQWSSYKALAKVISVLQDGSKENISLQLGAAHKVRSFYNNLLVPNSLAGHTTIDTHAVAAAYLLPVSGQHKYVVQAWGGKGGVTDSQTGLRGFYPYLQEAYRRIAEKHGFLPREIQSITWEQVRRLMSPAQKRDVALTTAAHKIWQRHSEGAFSAAEARNRMVKLFDGFDALPWQELEADTEFGRTYRGGSADAMDTAGTGQAVKDPVAVNVEAKPNRDPELLARWEALNDEQRAQANNYILDRVVKAVLQEVGANGVTVPQRGGWMGEPEPSTAVLLEDPDQAVEVADLLGEALHQEGMFILSAEGAEGLTAGQAVQIFLPDGYTVEQIDALYQDHLWPIKGPNGEAAVVGHSTQGVTMTIGVDPSSAGMTAGQLLEEVEKILEVHSDTFEIQEVQSHFAFRQGGVDYARQETTEEHAAEPGQPAEAGHGRVRREAAAAYREAFAAAEAGREAAPTEELSLAATGRRGRFFPRSREILLEREADTSTVLHEMLHEYVNALLVIASEEGAPTEVAEDVDVLMRWFKIEGETAADRLATWNSMSFEEQAPHQEAVSYNYELWLFNGTAPTTGLRRLFRRIRTFMLGVYTSLVEAQRRLSGTYEQTFGRELPGINAEVREMFERMAAGEQAALKLEAVRELGPLFKTKEEFIEAGNDASQWDAYQVMVEDTRQQLIDDLNVRSQRAMRWATGAQGRVLKELQQKYNKQRREVRAEVAEQVAQEPIYQLFDFFSKENTGVDREQFAAALPELGEEDRQAIIKRLGRKVRARGGMDPEFFAEFFPEVFPTGKHLVDAMVAAPTLEAAVDLRTAQEMQRRHGEAPTEESTQEQVELAVHSEARARFVAAETKFLEGARRPVRVMLAAAQEQARQILGNRALNDMSVHKFARLEDAAAAAAVRAMKEGDLEAALDAKHRQLLYNQLTKQALKAHEEIRKAKDGLFTRIARGNNEQLAKTRDVNRAHVARAVLSLYGLIPESVAMRTAEYLGTMRTVDDLKETYQEFAPLLAEHQQAGAEVDYDHKKMTLDQFRVVKEQVDTLWFHALREKQYEHEGKQRLLDGVVEEMLPNLEAKARPEIPGQRQAVRKGVGQSIKMTILGGLAAMTKVEHYTRWLDKGVIGPVTRYLFLNLKEAIDNYRADAVVHIKRLVAMLEEAGAKGLLAGPQVEATELGVDDQGRALYTFGKDGKSPAMIELIGALLHMGNESNRSKFLVAGRGGRNQGWADFNEETGIIDYTRWDAFISRLVAEGVLTKEHFNFVQDVWNLLDEIKPLLQRAHVKIKGYAMPEVHPVPFQIHFPGDEKPTTYAGGYVPASVDYEAAREVGAPIGPAELSEADMEKQYFEGMPEVAAGMTKARVEQYRKRPLTMDIGRIVGHIDQSMRYAHVAPAAKDVAKVLTHKDFVRAMSAVDPRAIDSIFKPLLDRAVTQSLYADTKTPGAWATSGFFKHFRRMVGIKIMAGNVVVALQQFTGLSNALLYVAPRYMKFRHLKSGLMLMLRRPDEVLGEMTRLSKFMDDRLKNQMFELSDDMRAITLNQSKIEEIQAQWIRWGYILQSTAQNMVDIVVWKGAFDQAMENATAGETIQQMERRATQEADSIVRLSQGSFSPEDVAGYEKGTAFGRLWTQFSSYFNTVLNQIHFAQEGQKTKAAIVGFMIPMLVAEAIAMTLYDRWEDEDEDGHVDASAFRELFLWSQVRGAAAMVPAFGHNAVNLFDQAFKTGRIGGDRVVTAPTLATLMQAGIGMLKAAGDLADATAPKTRDLRDSLSLAALLFPPGAAVAPFIRPASYGLGVARGEVEPTSVADAVRGALSGYASEASRR